MASRVRAALGILGMALMLAFLSLVALFAPEFARQTLKDSLKKTLSGI